MRFYLISDNVDTQVGMRLAGIEGVVVHEVEEVKKALDEALSHKDIGIILITSKLVSLCEDEIYHLKLNRKRPLFVEVPDRHGGHASRSIADYVHDAIGVNIGKE